MHVIVAACENMIDGRGMRPGDVLTAADGTTVEVNNTDAEGRLTLVRERREGGGRSGWREKR